MLLLSLMYDSGARVQEICDLRVRDVRLQKPPTVILTGKGRKTRFVPIMASTANVLTIYFSDNGLSSPDKADQPLFTNHQRGKLTRAGVTYILKKYFDAARQANPDLPEKISPHILRHSKAMHMLQAGINLIYIRDFLGHVHVETTEIYAKADTEMKRRAIESTHIKINLDLPAWTDDRDLMALLTNLCRQRLNYKILWKEFEVYFKLFPSFLGGDFPFYISIHYPFYGKLSIRKTAAY